MIPDDPSAFQDAASESIPDKSVPFEDVPDNLLILITKIWLKKINWDKPGDPVGALLSFVGECESSKWATLFVSRKDPGTVCVVPRQCRRWTCFPCMVRMLLVWRKHLLGVMGRCGVGVFHFGIPSAEWDVVRRRLGRAGASWARVGPWLLSTAGVDKALTPGDLNTSLTALCVRLGDVPVRETPARRVPVVSTSADWARRADKPRSFRPAGRCRYGSAREVADAMNSIGAATKQRSSLDTPWAVFVSAPKEWPDDQRRAFASSLAPE